MQQDPESQQPNHLLHVIHVQNADGTMSEALGNAIPDCVSAPDMLGDSSIDFTHIGASLPDLASRSDLDPGRLQSLGPFAHNLWHQDHISHIARQTLTSRVHPDVVDFVQQCPVSSSGASFIANGMLVHHVHPATTGANNVCVEQDFSPFDSGLAVHNEFTTMRDSEDHVEGTDPVSNYNLPHQKVLEDRNEALETAEGMASYVNGDTVIETEEVSKTCSVDISQLGSSVGQPIPEDIWMLVTAIKSLSRDGRGGLPLRSRLKNPGDRLIRSHVLSSSGILKTSSTLTRFYGDARLFNKAWWEFLVVQRKRKPGIDSVRS